MYEFPGFKLYAALLLTLLATTSVSSPRRPRPSPSPFPSSASPAPPDRWRDAASTGRQAASLTVPTIEQARAELSARRAGSASCRTPTSRTGRPDAQGRARLRAWRDRAASSARMPGCHPWLGPLRNYGNRGIYVSRTASHQLLRPGLVDFFEIDRPRSATSRSSGAPNALRFGATRWRRAIT